jgi:hypothetical protein
VTNFGNDKDKPFQYDINNCPGMELDCIWAQWKDFGNFKII